MPTAYEMISVLMWYTTARELAALILRSDVYLSEKKTNKAKVLSQYSILLQTGRRGSIPGRVKEFFL
jgi:hypothetical protein